MMNKEAVVNDTQCDNKKACGYQLLLLYGRGYCWKMMNKFHQNKAFSFFLGQSVISKVGANSMNQSIS